MATFQTTPVLFAHTVAAAEAQHAFAKEIAAHKAAIRDLKHRRNTQSCISKLPSEIMAAIFISLKMTVDWAALDRISGVCRHWRDILLSSPRIWSYIGVHSAEWTLELLRRSKSAPLHVNYAPVYCTEQHLRIAETIIAELGRIQYLDLRIPPSFAARLLHRNGSVSAPMLEYLRLEASIVMAPVTSPPDILLQEMPSLRYLELTGIGFSKLPPLPCLTHLKLRHGTIHTSLLLSLFQHSSNLEEVEIAGLVMDDHTDPFRTPIRLPNLKSISISSDEKLEVATIFANIEYPPSTRVTFTQEHPYMDEPNLSGLLTLCHRFAEIDPLVIDIVMLNGFVDYLDMAIKTHHHQLSLSLGIGQNHQVSCLALCSAMLLESVSTLNISGFYGMTRTEWTSLYCHFTQAHSLHLRNVPSRSLGSLLRTSSTAPPLPRLQTLHITGCNFRCEDTGLFQDLKCLLIERKSLGTPIRMTTIQECFITQGALEDLTLQEVTGINWDGREHGVGISADDVSTTILFDSIVS